MKRCFVIMLAVVILLPFSVIAEEPAMGQWGFTYGVFQNNFSSSQELNDFHVVGAQFYFPVNRYVAIGPSGLYNSLDSDWPKLSQTDGLNCDYWQASLDVKISTFPYKLINPFLIFHLGAYDLAVENLDVSNVQVNEGTHTFVAGTFGIEFSFDQFVLGARATAMTFEKMKYGENPGTETDVNMSYKAFLGFHYKL